MPIRCKQSLAIIFILEALLPFNEEGGASNAPPSAICFLFGLNGNGPGFDFFRFRQRDGQNSIIEISLCFF